MPWSGVCGLPCVGNNEAQRLPLRVYSTEGGLIPNLCEVDPKYCAGAIYVCLRCERYIIKIPRDASRLRESVIAFCGANYREVRITVGSHLGLPCERVPSKAYALALSPICAS